MIVCDALPTPADICEQTERIRAKGTRGLNCNWDKMVGSGQQSMFLLLSGFSSRGYSSSFPCGIRYIYEAVKVSTQVKSQTRHWPDFHGAMEQPHGV